MTQRNINNITMPRDLNLLHTLAVLLEERHISRAAKRMHITQPAMSCSLARLREEFNDPLFIRTPKGMLPTPKALSLEKPLHEALKSITALYSSPKTFDPVTATGTVRIATTDYFEQVIWTHLLGQLQRQAPQVKFSTILTGGELPSDGLTTGHFQLAIAGYFGDLPTGFMKQALFSDYFTCVTRKNHPVIKNSLSLESYLKAKHLLVSPRGDLTGSIDTQLQKLGKSRHIAASVSSFLSSGPVIVNSDYILTAPNRLVQHFSQYLPIKIYKSPLEFPKINVIQVWHERFHQDPLHMWLRKIIFDACQIKS
jgi:DNA-binding transcriptional LysR family regulator